MEVIKNIFIYGTVLSFAVYLALGLANPIARMFLVIILAAIVVSITSVRAYLRYSPVKVWFIFLSFITLYFVVTWMNVEDDPRYGNVIGFYANIGLSLGVFFFGLFCSKHIANSTLFKIAFFLFLLVIFYRFIFERSEVIDKISGNRTLNMGYDFVSLLPFLFIFKKKRVPIIVSPLIIYAVIMSIKRGAILITCLFYIYYAYSSFIKNEKYHKLRNTVIAVVLLLGIGYLASIFYFQNDYLQVRIQNMLEGDMNGRDYIYTKIIQHWLNGNNVFEFILGSGFCSSYRIAGNYAHNDWLELLSMSGLLGPIIYMIFFIKEYRYAKKIDNCVTKECIYVLLLIWFAKSVFSMSYCSIANMPMSLLLGYMIGISLKKPHTL